MFDGILFDLDGTLWDATETICAAWNSALECHPEIRRPAVTVAEIRTCMGMLLPDIAAKLIPELSPQGRLDFVEEYRVTAEPFIAAKGGLLYPHVAETLAALAELAPLYLVSNCQNGYIQGFFEAYPVGQYFAGTECAGNTGLPKGENIALVVARSRLKHPIYIGDTILDYSAAQQAGVPFLHAAYGFGQVDQVPAVACFADIPAALTRLSPP
ncbi:MAG: HAD family hydrolase [Pseudoflavonifractor sp.]